MSKCRIVITFDRPDRIYYGGDTVRGIAKVIVQEDTKGNGIKLTHQWRTHGRGNTDYGPEETQILSEPQMLMAGEERELPFQFIAPTYPVTYRGHLIYVDHYVRIDVDVPWAKNPSAEEEYLLRPGKPPAQMTGQRDQVISLKPPVAAPGLLGKALLWIVLLVILGVVVAFAFFLLPIIAAVAIWYWVRKMAIAARVGNVEVTMPHLIVAPKEPWPVAIRFTPRKSFTINSMTLKLVATESATSGSGSNKSTTTHPLYSEVYIIREGGLLIGGEAVDEKLIIDFPDTQAFSLDQSDNSINWAAEIRIDIPRYPDWSKTEQVQVVPIEFLGDQARFSDGSTGPGRTTFSGEDAAWFSEQDNDDNENDDGDDGLDVDDRVDGDGRDRGFEDVDNRDGTAPGSEWEKPSKAALSDAGGESADASFSFPAPTSILELVQQLASVDRHSSVRAGIIAGAATEEFDVSVLIDRIVTSIGTMNVGLDYENGKTITGRIESSEQAIEILTPEEMNAELEGFRRGDVWDGTIQVLSWDSLYNRIRAKLVL